MICIQNEIIDIDGYSDIIQIHENKLIFLFKKYQLILEGKKMKIISMNHHDARIIGKLTSMDIIYDE